MRVAKRNKATPRFLDLFVMPLRGSVAGSREAKIAASIARSARSIQYGGCGSSALKGAH